MSAQYLGEYPPLAPVDFKFNTHQSDGTPITLAGSPVISVYKDNSDTQTTTGPTLTVGFDSTTGLHHVRVAQTDSFYAMGSTFAAVLTAGTVDGVSVVGTTLATWKISKLGTNIAATVYGTVSASPTPTNTTCTAVVDVVPTVADQFKGRIIIFAHDTTTTNLRGQATDITASTAPGSSSVGLTYTALTTLPQTGDRFIIV